MSWTAEQQRLLVAMGLDPVLPAWMVPAAAMEAAPSTPSAPSPRARPVPAGAASDLARPETLPAPASTAALLQALRRAAGNRDIDALVEDIDGLRRNPALKRALWPRLRALRRSH